MDKKVLVASSKIPKSGDLEIKITKGVYGGEYIVNGDVARKSPEENMETKSGFLMKVKTIPLSELKSGCYG